MLYICNRTLNGFMFLAQGIAVSNCQTAFPLFYYVITLQIVPRI